jgi:hypothetical protein
VAALGKHLKGIFSGAQEKAAGVETGVKGATIQGDFDDVQ